MGSRTLAIGVATFHKLVLSFRKVEREPMNPPK